MKHALEPWRTRQAYGSPFGEGYLLFWPDHSKGGVHERRLDDAGKFKREDADRIVACVNACAGIGNDDLRLFALQRAEQIAALRLALEQLEEWEWRIDDEWGPAAHLKKLLATASCQKRRSRCALPSKRGYRHELQHA